jgi:hypothetical protein
MPSGPNQYCQGVRMFNGPDGLTYRWRPHGNDVYVSVSIHDSVSFIDKIYTAAGLSGKYGRSLPADALDALPDW